MPKAKDYQTSLGFYDLAIAAPSMKAALEAWSAGSNLFHQGVAKERITGRGRCDHVETGVVLRRPAGSNGRFARTFRLAGDATPTKSDRKRLLECEKRRPPKITVPPERPPGFEREQQRRGERQREKPPGSEARAP
jgi:hypothetical protein